MCHTLEEILIKYGETADSEIMEDLTEMTSSFVEDMRSHHPKEVEEFLKEVKELVNPHLDEHSVKMYCEGLENKDGTMGPHWTKNQTDEVMRKYELDKHTLFNDWDFYAAMNIVYSDSFEPKFTLDDYINLTKGNWLMDKDWKKDGKPLPGKIKWYLREKHKVLSPKVRY